jgi:putative peptide zinc metalloprotease protein
MKSSPATDKDLERRKQVKLRLRDDLGIMPHKYEGRTYYVVKDPVSLRYYRFDEQEHCLLELMNGKHTLDEAQKEFEKRFRPKRLTLEDLESFGQQLLTAGLAYNESPKSGQQLFDRRKKRRRNEWLQTLTNILYIKVPLADPDKLLTRMLPWLRWIYTSWFLIISVGVMLAAVALILTHFETFRDKLPSYHEFFTGKNIFYLWISIGLVKVIHEFGHGLSCKAFGGECHEMGLLLLCLSPCLYCNVSDAWTLPNKWQRIIISFAGIYVELIIAAIATFVWWNTPSQPDVNNLCLSLMIVCSVSTIIFNANPLMRYDGYYVLFDYLEIPNLRDRANRFLKNLVLEYCLGVEVQPERYMELGRRIWFVVFAIVSYIYRWVITFSILWFFSNFLGEKLKAVSALLVIAAIASMLGWPIYRLCSNLHKRGRLPDMQMNRVFWTCTTLGILILGFLFLPLPVSRVRESALVEVQPDEIEHVFLEVPGILDELNVRDGQHVEQGEILARLSNLEIETKLEEARSEYDIHAVLVRSRRKEADQIPDPVKRREVETQVAIARGEQNKFAQQVAEYEKMVDSLVIRAPRAGIVMGAPRNHEIGKQWEKELTTPFCSIGDLQHLRVLMPVPPSDYNLLQRDLEHDPNLDVTLRVQGRDLHTWKGKIVLPLPQSEATKVPFALTNKGGGPLAVKPSTQPNVYVPQSQEYLVPINIVDPDGAICPGNMAQVKIQCRWHSAGWWTWRKINSIFDLGLM